MATDNNGNTLSSGNWPANDGTSTAGSLAFSFNSTFAVGGTTTVNFYEMSNGYLTEIGAPQTVQVAANGSATATLSGITLTADTTYYASVNAPLITTSTGGVGVQAGLQFSGSNATMYWQSPPGATSQATAYVPAAYQSNYTACETGASSIPPFNPAPTANVHPTTYPTLDTTVTYQTVTIPIMGWKEYNASLPQTHPVVVRLTGQPPSSEYDPNGWQTVTTNIMGLSQN